MKNILPFIALTGLLAACAPAAGGNGQSSAADSTEPAAVPLEDTSWELIGFVDDGNTIAFDGQEYALTFREDGSVEAQLHCNSGGGSYTADGNELSFSPLFTTLMHCGDDSVADLFGRTLADVESFRIEGNELLLRTPHDSTLLFRAADTAPEAESGPADPRGGTWQLQEINRPDGQSETPEGEYSVTFSEHADELLVTADCNNGRGTFSLSADGTLSVGPVALTRMACPPGSLSVEFAQLLGESEQWNRSGNTLELVTADSTVLVFTQP